VRDVRVTVTTKSQQELTLRWQIDGPLGGETVVVYRSESRFGPYEPVCEPFPVTTTQEFIDTVPSFKIARRWYYQLKITRPNGEFQVFPRDNGFSNERRDDPEANMMAGDTEIRLNVHGDYVVYFPARTYGPRCSRCFDHQTGSQLLSNCPACYSTTYTGGFLTPVRLKIIIDQSVRADSADSSGIGVPFTSMSGNARFPWYLDVKQGDLIVEEDNRRWRVVEPVEVIRKRKVVLYQTAALLLLSKDASEYGLPVPEQISTPNRGFKSVPDCMR